MRKVWEKEAHICSLVWGLGEKGWHSHTLKNLKKTGSSMFFVESILVTPNRFRPANMMDGKLIEHPQNIFYGRMLRANIVLTEFSRGKKGEDGSIQKLDITMATRLWLNLQNEVCALLDSTTGTCFAFPHIDPVIGEMFMIWLACGHDNCCAMISSVC
jgi:DNA-directed RNA polymerase I subunit RPA1